MSDNLINYKYLIPLCIIGLLIGSVSVCLQWIMQTRRELHKHENWLTPNSIQKFLDLISHISWLKFTFYNANSIFLYLIRSSLLSDRKTLQVEQFSVQVHVSSANNDERKQLKWNLKFYLNTLSSDKLFTSRSEVWFLTVEVLFCLLMFMMLFW